MAGPRLSIALAAGTFASTTAHLELLLAAARRCEAAGVEGLVLDGRPPVAAPAGWRRLDPFTALGAVVAESARLSLAALVAADERAPSLAAKATATLDVCSGGRAILVLGLPSGPSPHEVAIEVLEEAVEVATAMLGRPAPTVVGRHMAIHEAWNEPRSAAGPPPVGVLLPGTLLARATRWAVPAGLVLVEDGLEAAPSPIGVTPGAPALGAGRFVHLAVGAPPTAELREAPDGGLVVALDDPAAATATLLEGLVQRVLTARGPR